MSATAYIEAVYQEPPIVLEIPLRPFSAGHRLLLERHVVFDGSPGQLAIAVLICSQTHAAALADLRSPSLGATLDRFARRLLWRGRWPFRRRRVIDLKAEWKRFEAWFESSTDFPPVSFQSRTGGGIAPELGSHFVLQAWIHARRSMTWEAFLDHPWKLTLWEIAAAKELEGSLVVLSPEAVDALGAAQMQADEMDALIRERFAQEPAPEQATETPSEEEVSHGV